MCLRIRIHPSPVPEHTDAFPTCKFWTRQPFPFDLQVFQQTVEQSGVALGCCLKHSLSCECFAANVRSIDSFGTEM